MPTNFYSKIFTSSCGIAIFLRCLPFGGAYCPNVWCTIYEALTDSRDHPFSCEDWDAEELNSPHVNELNEPSLLDGSMPFFTSLSTDLVACPCHRIRTDA